MLSRATPDLACSRHRPGATLIEVLVAIFVMGIGLLALLVLFPLGALNMAQSIRNDRCSQAAQNAGAIARILPHSTTASTIPTDFGIRNDDAIISLNSSGGYYAGQITESAGTLPAVTSGPSYPVYIDPAGVLITGGTNPGPPLGYTPPQMSNNPQPPTGIPRLMPNYLITEPSAASPPSPVKVQYLIARYFALLDDVTFLDNGLPGGPPLGPIQRDGRYTWCYMVQLPSYVPGTYPNTAPIYNTANLSVVVYDRRSLVVDSIPNVMPQPPQGERSFVAKFDPATNVVRLTWDTSLNQDAPAVKRGSWILDATLLQNNIHGYFYRVVGTSPPVPAGGTVMTMDVELQNNPVAGADPGVAVVMENVVEVFQRGSK